MTAPVVQSNEYMGFVMPFEYKDISQLPKPNDPRITLRQVPERIVACRCFSGWYSNEVGKSEFKQLQGQLLQQELVNVPKDEHEENQSWSISQYHPPFTLPFMRRNEIWVELNESLPAVRSLLQKLRSVI